MARKSIYPPSVTPGIPKLGNKPEGWTETTFGQVLQVVERKAQVHDDTKYQLVTAKRNRGGIVPRTNLFGRDILTKTQFFIKTGDFLISKRQIIHGACGVVPPDLSGALVSNEYAALRVKDGLLLEFLSYFCHTVFFQQTCFQASVGVDVEKMIFKLRDWLKYKIYLPPLSEQQKIVKILNTWDQAIILTEKRIEAAQQRKRAIMQQVLAQRRRFSEFGSEPWVQVKLGDLGTCIRGVSYNPRRDLRTNDEEDTVRLLRANNITEKGIATDDIQFVDSSTCSKRQLLRSGDIAICMSSGSKALVGKAAIFKDEDTFKYSVGAFCSIFRLEQEIDSDFFNQVFQSEQYRRKLAGISGGTNIQNLKLGDIEGLRFEVPSSSAERRRISAVLVECDSEIDLVQKKLDALRQQKIGLMQRLLTGRVRVSV